jgi:3-oxoacyl-[acyl-carrier-protein] synthase-3
MQKRYGRITGWGAYVPETILTNYDLEKIVDTSHEWIVQRTGIHQRHIAGPHETNATMSVAAAQRALEKANLDAADLNLIIVATTTGDHLTPAVSSQVQYMLGATDVPAFVLANGCTGFLYALTTAQQFISSGAYDNILVIGAELLSRFIDWKDRNTCVLFGDAAGAFVLQASAEPCGLLGFDMGSDGSGSEHIIAHAAGSAEPVNATTFAEGRQFIRMNGREVFKFATRILGTTSQRSLARADLSLDDIDCIVPHQANLRIIQAAARSMGLPMDRFLVKVHKYANTSAASIPVAICDGLDAGEIKLEDRLLLVSFGSGLTWASGVLQMAPARLQKQYTNGATAPKMADLVAA